MFYSIFGGAIIITILFSLCFIVGGYVCFKILKDQHEKERILFKQDILAIGDLKGKLKQAIIKLVKIEKSNTNILSLYDKLFAEVLVEVAKEVSYDDKELAAIHFEEYTLKRKAFEEKTL